MVVSSAEMRPNQSDVMTGPVEIVLEPNVPAVMPDVQPTAPATASTEGARRVSLRRRIAAFAGRVLHMGEAAKLRQLERLADIVDALEQDYVDMSDAELIAHTDIFKQRYTDGETLDQLMPEAFAVVREASRRTKGEFPYRVQIMGAKAIVDGNIAEMKTGEGKTLTGVMAAYLMGLAGKGVNVAAFNDYLAGDGRDLATKVCGFLGMEIGYIDDTIIRPAARRKQYTADITYGATAQFGFDYMRDNMSLLRPVQRGLDFAIVDEPDASLLDEAGTPLQISGEAMAYRDRFYGFSAELAGRMQQGEHYELDREKNALALTDAGMDFVEDQLGADIYSYCIDDSEISILWVELVDNALHAKELFTNGEQYLVENGEVKVLDEHTGRQMPGRRYDSGMHAAIEAKEGVAITDDNETLASMTIQNFYSLYKRKGGMTGTAMTETAEFASVYKLGTVPIPSNKPSRRIDHPDFVFADPEEMTEYMLDDIVRRHKAGQPILAGTIGVEKSEDLAALLRTRGIDPQVLNAKYPKLESGIVAEAGQVGAVTVATNMAGRGTDILLGGDHGRSNRIAHTILRREREKDPESYTATWEGALAMAERIVAAERAKVVALGGLYVLGTEHHKARRIDNQLRGRAGRQGDPGESGFYVSPASSLLQNFPLVAKVLTKMGAGSGPIVSKKLTNALAGAQTRMETQHYEQRKELHKYDSVDSAQREAVYVKRREVLGDGFDTREQVRRYIDETVRDMVESATAIGVDATEWPLEVLWQNMQEVYPLRTTLDEVIAEADGRAHVSRDTLVRELASDMQIAYDTVVESVGEDVMRKGERIIIAEVLTAAWRQQQHELKKLRRGINWRSFAERDLVVAYSQEAAQLFAGMRSRVAQYAVTTLFGNQEDIAAMVAQVDAAVEEDEAETKAPAQS